VADGRPELSPERKRANRRWRVSAGLLPCSRTGHVFYVVLPVGFTRFQKKNYEMCQTCSFFGTSVFN